MKASVSLFALPVIVLLFASCASTNPRYINNPAAHNAAFFREKGDLKFSAAFAGNPDNLFTKDDASWWEEDNETSQKNLGFDGQAAYAFTDHFMMQGGVSYRNERDVFRNDDLLGTNTNSKIRYERTVFDIGAGFYTAMGGSGKVFFNGVLGAGFGKSRSTDEGYPAERDKTYDFDFIRYSLTPSFNFFFTENARLAVVPRFSLLRANNITTNYTAEEQSLIGYASLPGKSKVFFEPGLLFQAGFPGLPWMKFDVGANFATNPLVTEDNDDGPPTVAQNRELRSRRFLLSLGFSFYPFAGK